MKVKVEVCNILAGAACVYVFIHYGALPAILAVFCNLIGWYEGSK